MSKVSKRAFCLNNNLEIQCFSSLQGQGFINIEMLPNRRFLIDEDEFCKLTEGFHYVSCPVCGKKMSIVTKQHYKSCSPGDYDLKPVYSELALKNRKKTDLQKATQSKKLKKRFNTVEGDVTRKQISKASKRLNENEDFLKRKSEISKEVQNRPENKKLRSVSSKKMWSSEAFRKKHKEYVEKNIELLRQSAQRARSYLDKTSKLHLKYKKAMLENNLTGFITEYELGHYSLDEADPISKIAIEIDGCYWHGCSKCGFNGDNRIKRIDKRKEGYLKKYGWFLIRIPEHEIKKDKNFCIELIKNIQEKRSSKIRDHLKKEFFKGNLKVRSMGSDGKVSWEELSDVCRHSTPHKRMLKVSTDCGSIDVTEDHSLFLWDTRNPVKTFELGEGSSIVSVLNNEIKPAKVLEVVEIEKQKKTYDVSVPVFENAFLNNGILVHNTYSISGVSLDVEKSGKYESMKNNFIQEYDKLKEQAKRSIKIIKGLKQPRYGIGISSALGPYSSPGVQSRRNWVSGGF